jgi:hypothetical protein
MARGQKTLQIEGHVEKQYTVYELTVGQIIDLFDGQLMDGSMPLPQFFDHFVTTILPIASNLTKDDVRKLTPSEVKILYDAFLEVNGTFFDLAKKSGVITILAKVKDVATAQFLSWLARSLSQGIQKSSTTATSTSS